MFDAIALQVFIGSPSDLPEERQAIRDALTDWNALNAESMGQVLLPRAWESHSTPDLRIAAQAAIDANVLDQADVLVGCFWTRLGSPTAQFSSGTVEEIEKFLVTGKPVLLYFSNRPVVPGTVDIDQLRALMRFRDDVMKRGLCGSFESPTDLRSQLLADLSRTVRSVQRTQPLRTAIAPSASIFNDGAPFTQDDHIRMARRSFRGPVYTALAQWETMAPDSWYLHRWYFEFNTICTSLTDAIGRLARMDELAFDSHPLITYLRSENRALRRQLEGAEVQQILRMQDDRRSKDQLTPDHYALAFVSLDSFLQRARSLADEDWTHALIRTVPFMEES